VGFGGGAKWSPLRMPDLVAAYLGEDVPDGAVVSVVRRVGTTNMTVTGTAVAAGGLIAMAGDGIAKAAFTWSAPFTRYIVFRNTDVYVASFRTICDGASGTYTPMFDHSSAAAVRVYNGTSNFTGAHAYDQSWHIWCQGCGASGEANGTIIRDLTTLKSNGALATMPNPGGITIGGTSGSTRRGPCAWAMALCFSGLHDAVTSAKIIAWMLARAQSVYGILTVAGFTWAANTWAQNAWMGNAWL